MKLGKVDPYVKEGGAVRGYIRGPRNFTLRVTDDVLERLQQAASKRDRSKQYVALMALIEFLERDENG